MTIYSSEPIEFDLKLYINENQNVMYKLQYDKLNITIRNCTENQIKMSRSYKYNKDTIKSYFYCENAVCPDECPINDVNDKAKCIIGYNNTDNIKELNICKCNPGWEGEYCNNKVFVDFK